MQSIRSVQRAYNKLIRQVKTHDFYTGINLTGRVNCYRCPCGHITKTVDVDPGVTPMFYRCESCNSRSTSTMYTDIAPELSPIIEWYRPSLAEAIKMRRQPQLLEHALAGGLLARSLGSGKALSTIETAFLDMVKDSQGFQLDVMIDFDASSKVVQHYKRVVEMLLAKGWIQKDDDQPDDPDDDDILFTYYIITPQKQPGQ